MGCGSSSKGASAAVRPSNGAPPPKLQYNQDTSELSARKEPEGAQSQTPNELKPGPEPQTSKHTETTPASEKDQNQDASPPEELTSKPDNPPKEATETPEKDTPENTNEAPLANEKDEVSHLATAPDTTEKGQTEPDMGAKQSAEADEADPLNEEVVKRFVNLDTEITELLSEDANCQLKTAEERVVKLKKDVETSKATLNKLKAKAEKEYLDVAKLKGANVHQFVIDNYQQKLSQEEEEYFSALNEQKMEERNYELLEEQSKKAEEHVNALEKTRNRLRSLQEEQESLLCDVFDGDYGSEREQKLELKVNVLMDKQRYVKTAHFRWSNARFYLDQSLKQLHCAIQRWVDLRRIHQSQRELIYRVATEARNNLTASLQNTDGARQYLLPQVHAPYCTKDDLQRLAAAVHRLYNDMMYPQSHRAAYDLYVDFYRRTCLFHQWIDQTLTENINKDLLKTSKKLAKKRDRLMAERKRILLLRVEGKEDEETCASDDDSDDEKEEEEEEDSKEAVKEVLTGLAPTEADAVSQHEGEDGAKDSDPEKQENSEDKEGSPGPSEVPTFKPVPLSELAPPPSTEQVYGDVDGLMKQHEDELLEFEKAKNRAKERTEEDLKEKLRQRRSRRRKKEQQAIQEQMLKDDANA